MKKYLLIGLLSLFTLKAFAQNNCNSTHRLFLFNGSDTPKPFNNAPVIVRHLGKGMQFYPLHGVTSRDEFFDHLKHAYLWNDFPDERKEINVLLKEIKFSKGINSPDLTIKNIEYTTFDYGTEGNLGGVKDNNGDRKVEYVFSKLNVGKTPRPVPAWKITGPAGCYFYVLQVCGNAFYPYHPIPKCDTCCCHVLKIDTKRSDIYINPIFVETKIPFIKCVYTTTYPCKTYQQQQHKNKNKGASLNISNRTPHTTVVYSDTTITVSEPEPISYDLYIKASTANFKICKDSTITIGNIINEAKTIPGVSMPSEVRKDTLKFYVSVYEKCPDSTCHVKFELGVNGGFAYNTIPNIDNVAINTKTSSAYFAGNIYFGYLVSKELQFGVDVSYLTLAYKDDAIYPKPVGNYQTYNDIYIGKPIIPIQAYGKVNFGNGNLTSQVSLSIGYSIVSNSRIENNGILLNTNPNVRGGLVAGLGFGFDYFFNCNFGIGVAVKASYFNLKGDQQNYNLFAFPTTVGLRFRFN